MAREGAIQGPVALFYPIVRGGDAKFAGHLALASLLDRIDMNDDIVGGLYSLFLKSGGFALFLKSPRGARRWLPRMKKATTQLAYVHEIVNYLCRSEQSGGGPGQVQHRMRQEIYSEDR